MKFVKTGCLIDSCSMSRILRDKPYFEFKVKDSRSGRSPDAEQARQESKDAILVCRIVVRSREIRDFGVVQHWEKQINIVRKREGGSIEAT